MRRAAFIALCSLSLLAPACTQRRIRVTSEPPGALVWLNDRQIGRTPVESGFTYHGLYDVRLELDGYEPVHEARAAKAPPHEWPGLDLVAAAAPVNFSKTHEWHFVLAPRLETAQSPVELETGLLARAGDMRARAEGASVPTAPPPSSPAAASAAAIGAPLTSPAASGTPPTQLRTPNPGSPAAILIEPLP